MEPNKPAEAPGSGDSASRQSCAGKPAKKSKAAPLFAGLSGVFRSRFPPWWECGGKRGVYQSLWSFL